ncbi:MAG TPA: hypothetical protein VFF81_07945 [Noviherbaspirillum sp.]|nr:hypothetical protein [Noviherbaspirillum sp.]
MQTDLDKYHELELEGYHYDGDSLVATVWELVVGEGHRVIRGSAHYRVTFPMPVAHIVIEELPVAVAGLVHGNDTGFLRVIENTALTSALGLNGEPFEALRSYALISAHEVLVVYCYDEPKVERA